jgi:hypothetical protein
VLSGRQNQLVSDYLFSDFIREQRPLRGLLDERARTARVNVECLRPDEFVAASDDELVGRLTEDWSRFAQRLIRSQSPKLTRSQLFAIGGTARQAPCTGVGSLSFR